jgi:Flp pilus assembly protein TadB
MRFRTKPRTINAELLAEMPREARQETRDANSGDGDSRSRLRWLAACAAGVLFVIGLKWVVEVLPAWAQVVAGILVCAHLVSIFLRSTRRTSPDAAPPLRALLLVWLAICVAATALVAIGGFQMEDRALLGVVWPILGLIWVVYRLRAARVTARPEAGSPGR